MNADQRAALLVLRDQISDQIDGDSPTDRYSLWAGLCDIALGTCDDPWMMMFHAPDIKECIKKHQMRGKPL